MAATTHDARIATAELLAVGAELLVGETRDTNSGDLAALLTDLGVDVLRISQLPDDLDVVTDAVRDSAERADLVITTGGLGPTPDDLTREAIAAALGVEPFVDPTLEAWLRDIWARRGLPFSDTNLKQAWLVPGASALDNPHGTAPGWWLEADDSVIIALPGPPRELHPMWRDQALPRLNARGLGTDRAATTLHLTGIGESVLVDVIGSAPLTSANPRMATYARVDSVDVRVSSDGEPGRPAREIVDAAITALSPRLDPYVYARDEDGWPEAIGGRLDGLSVATAEAGTSGYLGLLFAQADWLRSAEYIGASPDGRTADAVELAAERAASAEADVILAAVARETDDDMQVDVCVLTEGRQTRASHTVFRGGDAGRRRAANAAAAELWRQLSPD